MIPKKFSKAEYRKRADEIVARMKRETTPFTASSEEAKRERIARGRADRLWFFQTYLPHYFPKPFATFHHEWDELADVKDEPVFIAAPREHGKSVFWSLGIPVHDICHKIISPFDVIVSDTELLAADFSQFVQLEIEENERIRQDFGDLVNHGDWAANDFTTRNGVKVLARGHGQKVRGLRNRQHRVGRIIVDDLENDENVRNPRLVAAAVKWILEALINTVAEGGSMTMVNNLISKKGVLAQMIAKKREDDPEKPRFISRIYKALSDTNEPLWPDVWPLKRLLKKKSVIGSVSFNKEFQNDPKDDEGMFREEWIRYYYPEEIIGKALRVYTFIDPSSESGASNDYKAIITIGIDTDGIIYVLDAYIRRTSPNEMAKVTYTRFEELHPLLIGMEENALGEFAQSPFQLVARDKRYILPIRGIKNSMAKEARIGRISPHVERGILRFRKSHSDQDLLVEQLIYFPSTTVHDDGPDALEGAVDMAEKGSGVIEYQSSGITRVSCGKAVGRFVGCG